MKEIKRLPVLTLIEGSELIQAEAAKKLGLIERQRYLLN